MTQPKKLCGSFNMPDGTRFYARHELGADYRPDYWPHTKFLKSVKAEMDLDPALVLVFERFKDKQKHLARYERYVARGIMWSGPSGERTPGDYWFLIDRADTPA